MSFLLGKHIASLEMRIAAKASSSNRRGLFIEDTGIYDTTAINQHACRDAFASAYEWFLQTSLKPLYTEILFPFPSSAVPQPIRIPLMNIKLPSAVLAGNLITFEETVGADGTIPGNHLSAGDFVGVRNDRLKLHMAGPDVSVNVFDPMPEVFPYCTAVSTALSPVSTVDDFSKATSGATTFYVLRSPQNVSSLSGARMELVGRSLEITLPDDLARSGMCICIGGYATPTPCIPLEDVDKNDGGTTLSPNEYNSILQPLPSFMQLRLLLYYEEIIATAVLVYLMGMDDSRTSPEMTRLESMINFSKQLPPDVRVIYSANK